MSRASVPFLWLCGPSGVGKSAVGYEVFQQVYRSGVKASFMDFDQLGLCYPSPAGDPDNHHVKAQNLAAVWPTYRTAGARCLIAVGGVTSRQTVMLYAARSPTQTSPCAGCAPHQSGSPSEYSAADWAGAR